MRDKLKIYHIGLCATTGTNNGLQRAFKNNSIYKEIHTGSRSLNSLIIKEVKEFKPDIVFMQIQTPGIVFIETIKEIKQHCGKIVNFTGDVREPLPLWYIEMGRHIDLSLFVSMEDVNTSRDMGINSEWIQIGFDDFIFNKNVIPSKVPEIIFSANNYSHFSLSAYRKEIATALSKEFKNRFQLYGNGWHIPALDSNSSLEKQAQIIKGAKINISCSNMNHSMYISDRVLRIMGAGGFCLSHEFKDIDKLYKENENIAVFRNIKELISKCHYYLENENERQSIANNGYELTHSKWTWDLMIKQIIKLCE